MKELFLLDVSGFIFRAYFALPPMSNAKGEATHALFGFVRSFFRLIKDFSPTHIAAVFDGPESKRARTEIYADYKAHRKPTPPDLLPQIERAAQFCELEGIPRVAAEGVEADDAIGTIATHMANNGVRVYICSSDKDFCQLVDTNIVLLNTFKDNLLIDANKVEELYGVRPEQIVDYLAITGDASDNIPGLPGFGPKTASSLLQQFDTLDHILANPDQVSGKKKQETIREQGETARLSRQLAQIDTAVDCPTDPAFFEKKPADQARLQEFFKEMDFKSLRKETLREEPAKKEVPIDYRLVDDEVSFAKLVQELQQHKEICFDTETTDVRPIAAELVGIGFCVEEGRAWYVPVNGKLGLQRVLDGVRSLFENEAIGFYGHNVKYDMHVLANYSIVIKSICFDTILASYLLNSASRRHSLDVLALDHFDKVKIATKDLLGTGRKAITMDQVPIEQVAEYCCEDVDYTLRLKQLFAPQLKQRNLDTIFYSLELPLLPVLFRMERRGIYVDVDKLHHLSKTLVSRIAQLQEEIWALAGETFKINSPKQLSHILFDKLGIKPLKKTTTGFSTRAEVLEELRDAHPIMEKLLEYRGLEKLRSTYADTLPGEVNPKTHRIHCTFMQTVAATGRLSCQDPNLQNIPVRTPDGQAIRGAFEPQSSGWLFLSADYSQIELRILAHLSEDPELTRAFTHGEDIHAYTASLLFGVPITKIDKQQRHAAKAVNFGIVYGQQAFGLSREIGTSVGEAAAFIETYFSRYPRVREFVKQCKQTARKTGKAVTMMGRERALPDISSRNAMQRQAAERLAINTPLQGSAADLIKVAMLQIDKILTENSLQANMLLQIHDELVFEVFEQDLKTLQEMACREMETAITLKVPLVVDVSVGKNWQEC